MAISIVKICDRCGKAIEFKDGQSSRIEFTPITNGIPLRLRKDLEYFDLCDNCTEDFKKFMSDKLAP